MENTTEKKSYTAPELVIFGTVDEITQGTQAGGFTDATFPTETAREDLTFS